MSIFSTEQNIIVMWWRETMNRSKWSWHLSLVTILLSLCFLFKPAPTVAKDSDSWEFHIAPYAWLAGLNGKIATLPGLPPADVDVNFYDDILGNINGAFMLVAEARKGSFGITTDVVYNDIESDASFPGQNFTKVTSQTKNWLVSAAGFYRLWATDKAFVDGLAGARYWSVDSELTLSGGAAGVLSVDDTEGWFDPLLGFKGLTMLGNSKFYVSGVALIGGFGVGSHFMWDVNANLGYQWTETFATTLGYRYLDVDYENDDFLYDVAQDGITIGFSWRF
jgi:hypothetical protein